MTVIRRFLWIVPVIIGLVFVGAGTYTIGEGFEARDLVRAELANEQVTTSKEASIPSALVMDAATAEVQAATIKEHTYGRFGPYSGMERDDPNRATYIKDLTLRNSLNMAVLGFKVSELVVGIGALVIGLGFVHMFLIAPVLFWTRPMDHVATEATT
ncbi:MAG: hypothetical protein QF664_13495 [Dehalococcoidia bacterium]|jgi:hypothetical protein|nr:hypothetical protein [Dehalococcoidia bacterium]